MESGFVGGIMVSIFFGKFMDMLDLLVFDMGGIMVKVFLVS